jgi:DNA-binding transcriptional MerR regulator
MWNGIFLDLSPAFHSMAMQLAQKRAFETPTIPDRLYFKIGDVARICEVETYVLRFWETQFPQLKPNKSGTGQRLYRRRDVELALKIKSLVHGEGYTIAGARQVLEGGRQRGKAQQNTQPRQPLLIAEPARPEDLVAAAVGRVRSELREILSLLSSPEPQPLRRRARLLAVPASSGQLFPS